jgi:hypothetical protein
MALPGIWKLPSPSRGLRATVLSGHSCEPEPGVSGEPLLVLAFLHLGLPGLANKDTEHSANSVP